MAFGAFAIAPRYVLSSEVGLIQLMETVLGPLWVWLAGYEEPPMLTLAGGLVLLVTLGTYFAVTLREEERQQRKAAAAAAVDNGTANATAAARASTEPAKFAAVQESEVELQAVVDVGEDTSAGR